MSENQISYVFDNEKLFNNQNVWKNIIKNLGYDEFVKQYIETVRNNYNKYIKEYDTQSFTFFPSIFYADKKLRKTLSTYICEKIGIENSEFNKTDLKCDDVDNDLIISHLLEYIYFDQSPSIINQLFFKGNKDKLTINNDNFYYDYFIWRRKDDPNIIKAPAELEITKDNFKKFSVSHSTGWSIKQLKTYFITQILPIILQTSGLNINVNLKGYKKIIYKFGWKRILGYIINMHLNNKLDIDNSIIEKIDRELKRLLKDEKIDINYIGVGTVRPYKNRDIIGFHNRAMDEIYDLITLLKIEREKRKNIIQARLEKIKKYVIKKDLPEKYKYKWQRMCAKLTTFDIEELRELAAIEGVKNFNMKSKRELCKELYEILDDIVEKQRLNKIRFTKEDPNDPKNIHNNLTEKERADKIQNPELYQDKCHNDESVFTLDNISNIKPEFLFTYEHNNKLWCEDIRYLYRHVITEGKNTHPFDRTKLSNKIIKNIKNIYEHLRETMSTLEDEDEDYLEDVL